MYRWFVSICTALAIVAVLALTAQPVSASGATGCTPGFWKTHESAWSGTGVMTTTLVASVLPLAGSPYSGTTFLQALSLQGGPGINGATETLLRAFSAAYLNANSVISPTFPLTAAFVVSSTASAINSQNRDTMLNLATTLDQANNGVCPLGGPTAVTISSFTAVASDEGQNTTVGAGIGVLGLGATVIGTVVVWKRKKAHR